jgi:hypothetical protein
MRFFLCPFGSFTLAVPMRDVSSIALHTNQSAQMIEQDEENKILYISLPCLLNLPLENTKHSILLRGENKLTLLTTEVECDREIPDNAIFPLPRSLREIPFAALFSGINFNEGNNVNIILILNIEELEKIIRKMQHDKNINC